MKYFRDYNRYSPLRLTATLQSPSHQYPKGLDWLLERTQLWLRIKQYMPDIPFTTNTNSHFQGNAQGDSYRDGPWLGDEEALDGFSKLGVRQFELNLRMIVALALETGAQPILLTQPRLVRRDNSAEERERIVYDHQGLTHDTLCSAYEATDQIVAKIGRASGVGYFDFASAVRGDPRFFVDHVHLNIEGNAELSTILSDYIASELLKR